MSQWPVHLFTQAAQFIKRAQHVNALVAAGSFGGSAVKINVDEVGIIGGKHCKIATDAFSTCGACCLAKQLQQS